MWKSQTEVAIDAHRHHKNTKMLIQSTKQNCLESKNEITVKLHLIRFFIRFHSLAKVCNPWGTLDLPFFYFLQKTKKGPPAVNYLCLADNVSKRPAVHNSRIEREHQDTAGIQNTVVRHGDKKVARLEEEKDGTYLYGQGDQVEFAQKVSENAKLLNKMAQNVLFWSPLFM